MIDPHDSTPRGWKSLQWFQLAIQIEGSVLPNVLPRSLACAALGVGVTALHRWGFPVSLSGLIAFLPNIVLGLMLVFRTNTAYERFWEGRKAWGSIVNASRNLARLMWVGIQDHTYEDRQKKVASLYWLPAFAIATKQLLRQESSIPELNSLLSAQQLQELQPISHPPLRISFWIGQYLHHQYEMGHINAYQLNTMVEQLNLLVESLGACERILATPMPLAYALHLKQLLIIYCFSLPFQMVDALGWMTGIVVGFLSFILFGIEQIGIEIENPFGRDPNDLPLDLICEKMRLNITDLIESEIVSTYLTK